MQGLAVGESRPSCSTRFQPKALGRQFRCATWTRVPHSLLPGSLPTTSLPLQRHSVGLAISPQPMPLEKGQEVPSSTHKLMLSCLFCSDYFFRSYQCTFAPLVILKKITGHHVFLQRLFATLSDSDVKEPFVFKINKAVTGITFVGLCKLP